MTDPKTVPWSRSSPLDVNDPDAHPDAATGGGGPGRFRAMKSPIPMGSGDVKADGCYQGPTAGYMDSSYCEEVKPGTKESITDEASGVRMVIERKKDGLYYWLIETLDSMQVCEGVYDPETEFAAEACEDKTSKEVVRELEKQVAVTKKKVEKKQPSEPPEVKREILMLTIKTDDWLTKISRDLWHTFEWERHLEPTEDTLDRRRRKGEIFDPNLIYPGDTFEIIN